MKRFLVIIGIPLLILAGAIGVAFQMRSNDKAKEPQNVIMPAPYKKDTATTKNGGYGTVATAPASLDQQTTNDLSQELNNTVDDGGQQDLDALKAQTTGL
jgi:hypothetical protein